MANTRTRRLALARSGGLAVARMHIHKYKVKPRKQAHVAPCALELTTMLGCWASSGDLTSGRECREAMLRLQECMRKPMPKGKPRVSSINYHLARANASR
ncbi:Mitochondrial ribosomal protein subunit Mrp10 [Rhodotorula toruloides]|nr:Mitochondrial ribosomal protein subunit Mrp10 [Rhodotorula toruloides]